LSFLLIPIPLLFLLLLRLEIVYSTSVIIEI
jgi:hypothetical protein